MSDKKTIQVIAHSVGIYDVVNLPEINGKNEYHLEHKMVELHVEVYPKPMEVNFLHDGGLIRDRQSAEVFTSVMVDGLMTSMHSLHQNGIWDSADHYRYILAELERKFLDPATVNEFTNDGK